MRIELTIKTTYLPNWKAWEGIRELVQNAKDAETEFGAKMTVRHRKESNTLVIENEGTTLPHEALLLGFTSKDSRSDTIGKFGEGLKLGILALVRLGLKVKIRSGSEVWVPLIARSEKFNADVLAFDIYKGRKDENRVQIEVSGFDQEVWEKLRSRFLFLMPVKGRVETGYGSLLTDSDSIGRVYVKGILVMDRTELKYGYDIREAEIDRDRKMVESYDLQWRTGMIWAEAVSARPDLFPEYMKMLEAHSGDLANMSEYAAGQVSSEILGKAVEAFKTRHGDNALPVQSLAESAEIQHLGMVGVVTPPALRKVLERELGNVQQNKVKLSQQVQEKFGWHQLSAEERGNLVEAVVLVNRVEPITLEGIDVCSFRDPKLFGLFVGGSVQLSKGVLSSPSETLATLVHEVAHKAGGNDGEKQHVENIERIWSGIVAGLRDQKEG